MAFLTVRIDELNKESKLREYKSSFNNTQRSTNNNGVIVRYINPAAFIEKSPEADTSDESFSEIVPPLDLNSSGDTLNSENGTDGNYHIQKAWEVSKITKSDAFANWLSAKKKLKSYEIAKKKEILDERQRQMDQKKELAEKKYQEWLSKKMQLKAKSTEKHKQVEEYQVYQPQCNDSESNRRAWEQSKREELRRKKEELIRNNQRKKAMEEERKKRAAKAWEMWLAEAPFKPKPVPLNKGFLTLKGTISDIYVNPNPWHNPYEIDDD